MAKTPKNKSTPNNKLQSFFSAQPWKCTHYGDHSEITAYVEASGKWEVVATIPMTLGASPETIANFVCGLVHNHQQHQNVLKAAMEALESVIQDGLNFSTEQIAEHVVKSIKCTIKNTAVTLHVATRTDEVS